MNAIDFDELTLAFAGGVSRRAMLRALVGAGGAGDRQQRKLPGKTAAPSLVLLARRLPPVPDLPDRRWPNQRLVRTGRRRRSVRRRLRRLPERAMPAARRRLRSLRSLRFSLAHVSLALRSAPSLLQRRLLRHRLHDPDWRLLPGRALLQRPRLLRREPDLLSRRLLRSRLRR